MVDFRDCIYLAQNRGRWWAFVDAIMDLMLP
jgi:hypothetical protein